MTNITVSVNSLNDIPTYLECGADEVVVALKGLCHTALPCFTLEQIKDVGHVSVLMNRLFFEEEIENVKNTLLQLEEMEIDSIYFADPAVLYLASANLKKKLIYRPETLMTSSMDIRFWKDRGIQSVSISSLLTESEVVEIVKDVENCEVTIHGHMMMSVSRRRLLEFYEEYGKQNDSLDQRRDLYLREEKRDDLMPIYQDEFGTMIYTDFVQQSFRNVKELVEAGTQRLYISSVYSKTEEIVDAIKSYRAILNGSDYESELSAYQVKHPTVKLSEGYYGQKTIK